MKTIDAVNHFETQAALAEQLHCAQSTVASWGEYPPDGRQLQIEKLTKGKLKAELSFERKRKSRKTLK